MKDLLRSLLIFLISLFLVYYLVDKTKEGVIVIEIHPNTPTEDD